MIKLSTSNQELVTWFAERYDVEFRIDSLDGDRHVDTGIVTLKVSNYMADRGGACSFYINAFEMPMFNEVFAMKAHALIKKALGINVLGEFQRAGDNMLAASQKYTHLGWVLDRYKARLTLAIIECWPNISAMADEQYRLQREYRNAQMMYRESVIAYRAAIDRYSPLGLTPRS